MTSFDDDAARRRLESERERVHGLIDGMRAEGLGETEAEQVGELTHYDQHPADQASETFEREKDLSILEGLESDLAEIEAALRRIDDGSYGVDEVTGDPIDRERLEALPTARTNVDTPHQARPMVRVRLLLFAAAREVANRRADEFELGAHPTLGSVLQQATERYGDGFAAVLATARVWVNGDEPPAGAATALIDDDEVAVLPPVSGGARS